jgi:hypothetical protein
LVDIASCIDTLSPQVSWLDAKGLIAHHLDSRGSATRFVQRLLEAATAYDVVLLRAGVAELARALATPAIQSTRPVLVTDLQSPNFTAAYAAMKWLRERSNTMVFGLLVSGPATSRLTQRMAHQLADCAERFLGAALPAWAAVHGNAQPTPALRRLARDALMCEGALSANPMHARPEMSLRAS